jgi:SPP1 family predicted phage head-tail adaptor
MQAGQLRKRVTVQQRSTTQDTHGQPLTEWTEYMTVWAAVQPLSGRKLIEAEALHSETTHEVLMRYHAGITAKMRVMYGEKIFNVQNVIDEDERHRHLTLLCSEGLNDG